MNVNHVSLEISAVTPSQYPKKHYPEIAFVGRSNVGKSSLTNALIHRKNYAYTSNQPGKTQTLNFYNVEDQLYFVDIPGYGYARVSQKEREKWADMIDTYLTQRSELKGVILLIDGRRAPSNLDAQMKIWLNYYHLRTLVVLTKMDKVKKSRWNRSISQAKKKMGLADHDLVLFSTKNKMNLASIWKWILANTHVDM